MERHDLKGILAKHEFLQGLPPEYLDLLVGCAANVRFDEGQHLFKVGEDADRFYLIRKGRVRVELPLSHRPPITVQTVDAGEVLGWSWIIPPYSWHFSARAMEPVLALSFDGKCLRAKCDADARLGHEMCRRFSALLGSRMENVLLQMVGLCS